MRCAYSCCSSRLAKQSARSAVQKQFCSRKHCSVTVPTDIENVEVHPELHRRTSRNSTVGLWQICICREGLNCKLSRNSMLGYTFSAGITTGNVAVASKRIGSDI